MPRSAPIPVNIMLPGLVAIGVAGATAVRGADPADLERRFAGEVHPFLESHCIACHGKEKRRGKLDLSSYATVADVIAEYQRWETVLAKLEAGEMPPDDAERQPPAELRRSVIEWIRALRRREVERHRGDPGPVLPRRLSNAEYDHTIRDLTGADIRPAREFPVDPANQAGFDNSGESLAMSPTLLAKYLEAARTVAEHLVLTPTGLAFAPHPAVTETDRDKYCVQRIVDFYARQRTDYADYFLAAWRYRHRAALRQSDATLAGTAARDGLSARYLETIWTTLDGASEVGPLARLQAMWRDLPPPDGDRVAVARRGCVQMREYVQAVRRRLTADVPNLTAPGIADGSQSFVLWKDRQLASRRRRFDPANLQRAAPVPTGDDLVLPDDEVGRARLEASLSRFCSVFPDAFYVAERGLVFLKEDKESKGRLLSAGFHLMFGYFRDDQPLRELILDDAGQRELDALWDELRFITLAPIRQYKDYIFFERAEPPRFMQVPELDFARSEDKDVTSEAKIQRLAEGYIARARGKGAGEPALRAIEDYFRDISAEIRWVETNRLAAEPRHLDALLDFAGRAYRRPLVSSERDDLLAFYRSLRQQEGLDHEEAMRDAIVSVLASPSFCYRVDAPRAEAGAAAGEPAGADGAVATVPLSDHALASRLSYFLWSSMPDRALLERAAAGDLHRPGVLLAQVRRMLDDDRVRGLVTELGGNWLDFRRFEEHNAVDRERFPSFTDELRRAMLEEPIRFFLDVIREDRSVLDFLHAGRTFVNPVLARHYGMPERDRPPQEWVRVDDASTYGRGGLLPMAVFLTRSSPGRRTSPVKRGYWVVRRLLGEVIPAPPPNVPELPNDEGKLGDLTLRETLERHRQGKACAGCHARFDAIGLALEGYGPVGERRTQDLGGRPVDTHASFPGGGEGAGLEGLRAYLREQREADFIDNLCRKLLAYALGRSLILSDDATIEEMRAKLAASSYRFRSLVETIVTSPQFLRKRGPAGPTKG